MPIEHVFYLKTHKTGSTTMYSILAEYCRSHELLPLLPFAIHINQAPPFLKSQVYLDRDVDRYDMVFNHHVYTPHIFKYLHNDTFRFTTLREPFAQTVSSFQYFRREGQMPYLKAIGGQDPVATYLTDPMKYEAKGYRSYTNNRQSMDLGYDISHPFNDTRYIQQFLDLTDKRFHLVLITEYFHQSLILLKRTLHWTTGDILYYIKNARSANSRFENRPNVSMATARRQHASYSQADISLYDFFLKKFKGRMDQEQDLQGEVTEFESVLDKVHEFCRPGKKGIKRLDIAPGRWTDPVSLLMGKCKWLKLDEPAFTRHLQRRQDELLLSGRAAKRRR